MDMENVERLNKKSVQSHPHGDTQVTIFGADLGYLNVDPGDEVQVITTKDEIIIRSAEDG